MKLKIVFFKIINCERYFWKMFVNFFIFHAMQSGKFLILKKKKEKKEKYLISVISIENLLSLVRKLQPVWKQFTRETRIIVGTVDEIAIKSAIKPIDATKLVKSVNLIYFETKKAINYSGHDELTQSVFFYHSSLFLTIFISNPIFNEQFLRYLTYIIFPFSFLN